MFGFVGVGCGSTVRRPGVQAKSVCRKRCANGAVGLRMVANAPVDTSFELADEVRESITKQLEDINFLQKVALVTGSKELVFTGIFFRPLEYSSEHPRGVPLHFENFLDDPKYKIVHVPQVMMLTAGCFRPSKLCAIFLAESSDKPLIHSLQTEEDLAWKNLGTLLRQTEQVLDEERDNGEDDDDVDLDEMVI